MRDPVAWAKAAIKSMGPAEALRVAEFYNRPMIGQTNDVKNPHYEFYKCAHGYIKKRQL